MKYLIYYLIDLFIITLIFIQAIENRENESLTLKMNSDEYGNYLAEKIKKMEKLSGVFLLSCIPMLFLLLCLSSIFKAKVLYEYFNGELIANIYVILSGLLLLFISYFIYKVITTESNIEKYKNIFYTRDKGENKSRLNYEKQRELLLQITEFLKKRRVGFKVNKGVLEKRAFGGQRFFLLLFIIGFISIVIVGGIAILYITLEYLLVMKEYNIDNLVSIVFGTFSSFLLFLIGKLSFRVFFIGIRINIAEKRITMERRDKIIKEISFIDAEIGLREVRVKGIYIGVEIYFYDRTTGEEISISIIRNREKLIGLSGLLRKIVGL